MYLKPILDEVMVAWHHIDMENGCINASAPLPLATCIGVLGCSVHMHNLHAAPSRHLAKRREPQATGARPPVAAIA